MWPLQGFPSPSESVTGSFLQLYHYLVHKVCISALCNQIMTVGKQKAVEEDQMTWTQILNNEDREVCDVVKLYGITAFPTKVLIDPEGKIIVKTVGESAPIDEKLKEVFGN